MEGIKSCKFDMDTNMINIVYENGNTLCVYTVGIEENLRLTPVTKDKLRWLIDNEPMTYVELALSSKMQDYLDRIDDCYTKQVTNLTEHLQKKHSKSMAEYLAREFLMYES